jgi:hypothetical protein
MMMRQNIIGNWYKADFGENFNIMPPIAFLIFNKKLSEKKA